jgi:tetratricopeptide (TPR) repeat protein
MKFLVTSIFLFFTFLSSGQILQDAQAKSIINQGLEHLYAYNFNEAHEDFVKLKNKYPKHPAAYLLIAMQLEKQYYPLVQHPIQGKAYLKHLETTLSLAELAYEKNNNDQEAIFFCSSALGFLAAYEADNQNFVKAVNHTRKAFPYLKIALKNTDNQPEYLYSTGIYNYYRVVYPELHPVIKPLMYFFEDGDKKRGIAQLELATKKSLFVKNESKFYLGYIFNKYEGLPQKGLISSQQLIEKYPNNLLFNLQRAELLTLTGQYEQAEIYLDKLEKSKKSIFTSSILTLRGLREEFGNKRYNVAENYYQKALLHAWEERFTKDIYGLALLGSARLEFRKGNKSKAIEFAKKAADFVEYKNSIAEQKRLLKLQ